MSRDCHDVHQQNFFKVNRFWRFILHSKAFFPVKTNFLMKISWNHCKKFWKLKFLWNWQLISQHFVKITEPRLFQAHICLRYVQWSQGQFFPRKSNTNRLWHPLGQLQWSSETWTWHTFCLRVLFWREDEPREFRLLRHNVRSLAELAIRLWIEVEVLLESIRPHRSLRQIRNQRLCRCLSCLVFATLLQNLGVQLIFMDGFERHAVVFIYVIQSNQTFILNMKK